MSGSFPKVQSQAYRYEDSVCLLDFKQYQLRAESIPTPELVIIVHQWWPMVFFPCTNTNNQQVSGYNSQQLGTFVHSFGRWTGTELTRRAKYSAEEIELPSSSSTQPFDAKTSHAIHRNGVIVWNCETVVTVAALQRSCDDFLFWDLGTSTRKRIRATSENPLKTSWATLQPVHTPVSPAHSTHSTLHFGHCGPADEDSQGQLVIRIAGGTTLTAALLAIQLLLYQWR